MKLTEASYPLRDGSYRSLDPVIRSMTAGIIPASPFRNFLISSRYFPFHSDHRFHDGKLPTWYNPPASHASAISFTCPRIGSKASLSRSGGLLRGVPSSLRPRIEARSNRNPSIRYSITQYL